MDTTNNFVQTNVVDKIRIQELLLRAKGPDRNMKEFSEKSGINTSTLSRIKNGDITKPLTQDVLEAIYDAADPDAGITMEALYSANGMISNVKSFLDHNATDIERRTIAIRRAKNIISDALCERGIDVFRIPYEKNNRHIRHHIEPFDIQLRYDFDFYTLEAPEQFWYFNVIETEADLVRANNRAIKLFLLEYWAPEFLAGTRTSFVFFDEEICAKFMLPYINAPIASAVTVILIDRDRKSIHEEWIIEAKSTGSLFERDIAESRGGAGYFIDDEFEEDF